MDASLGQRLKLRSSTQVNPKNTASGKSPVVMTISSLKTKTSPTVVSNSAITDPSEHEGSNPSSDTGEDTSPESNEKDKQSQINSEQLKDGDGDTKTEEGNDDNAESKEGESETKATVEIRSLVDTGAFPVASELDYLLQCGYEYEILNPLAYKSSARCPRACVSMEELRSKVIANGRPRRFHKNEENVTNISFNICEEYKKLLNKQCGPSPYRKVDKNWVKLGKLTYLDPKTNRIYCRNQLSEFSVAVTIPKIEITIEHRDDGTIQSVVYPPEPTSVVASLENEAFRELYEKAKKNLESTKTEEDPVCEKEIKTTETEEFPITGFHNETPIQRALRLAKERYALKLEANQKKKERKIQKVKGIPVESQKIPPKPPQPPTIVKTFNYDLPLPPIIKNNKKRKNEDVSSVPKAKKMANDFRNNCKLSDSDDEDDEKSSTNTITLPPIPVKKKLVLPITQPLELDLSENEDEEEIISCPTITKEDEGMKPLDLETPKELIDDKDEGDDADILEIYAEDDDLLF